MRKRSLYIRPNRTPNELMREWMREPCESSYHFHSIKAMVPGAGIEPARLAAGDFESPASTNFTTRARYVVRRKLWHIYAYEIPHH